MARPRKFDEDSVLELALTVFWEHGYEGTSLMNICEATGLTKTSLYAAFGNKESLYNRVVDRYQRHYMSFRMEALAKSTPREIVEELLFGIVDLHISERTPRGCLVTNGGIACSAEGEPMRGLLCASRELTREALHKRFEELESLLPADLSAEQGAFFVATLIQGMAVQAKSGCSKEELLSFVKSALSLWPK